MNQVVYKTGHQSSDDPFKFIMSTDAVDRSGDIIEQSGWRLADFRKNPIALWQHSANFPIGTWQDVKVQDGRLVGTLKMAAAGTSKLVDEIRSLLEQRILRAVSVGFTSDKSEPLEADNEWGPMRFLKQTLLECSVVSVPANQEALMTRCKALGISKETQQVLMAPGVQAPTTPLTKRAGVPACITAPLPKHKFKETIMSLADRIKQKETALDELRGNLNGLMEETEGREFSDDESIQIEELSDQIADAEKSLATLQKAQAGMCARGNSTALTKSAPRPAHQRSAPVSAMPQNPNDRPGSILIKAAVIKAIANHQKRSESEVFNERYGSDPRKDAIALALNTKADASTATTTGAGWAAELVTNETRGWVADLEAVSIYGALAAAGTSLDFGGANSVTVPSRDRTSKVSGSWVGENATIPVKDGKFTSIALNRFKKAVISIYSEELMATSNPNIEAVLRDAIRIDTAESVDTDLMDVSAGVASIRPASILNGQPTQASAGATLDDIHTDLKWLMDQINAVNAGRNLRWIMNPAQANGLKFMTNATGAYVFRDEMRDGSLVGHPFIISTNNPAGVVTLCDAADFSTAAGTPEFRVSNEATFVMLNDDGTDPTMADTNAVSVAGSVKVSDAAGVVGGPAKVKSMFQQYSTALRSIYPMSWTMMRSGTAPYLTGVAW